MLEIKTGQEQQIILLTSGGKGYMAGDQNKNSKLYFLCQAGEATCWRSKQDKNSKLYFLRLAAKATCWRSKQDKNSKLYFLCQP